MREIQISEVKKPDHGVGLLYFYWEKKKERTNDESL